MVEVRFVCIPSVAGVRCTIDGITKLSDESGIASFFNIAQGIHTYSVEAPSGWHFVSGEDVFGRPLTKSGTTTIEWVEISGTPWPENQPWMMLINFEEGEEPSWIMKNIIPITIGAVLLGVYIALTRLPKPIKVINMGRR